MQDFIENAEPRKVAMMLIGIVLLVAVAVGALVERVVALDAVRDDAAVAEQVVADDRRCIAADVEVEAAKEGEEAVLIVQKDIHIAGGAGRAADRSCRFIPLKREDRHARRNDEPLQVIHPRSWVEVVARATEETRNAGIDEAGFGAVPGVAPAVAGG